MNLYAIRSIGSKKYFVKYEEHTMRMIWSEDKKDAKEWYTRQAARDGFQEILNIVNPLVTWDLSEYYEVVPIQYTCKVRPLSDYRF